jgi:cytochrome c biogenesis protein CcdA/thiol-disulfide isomerase/thioredoxin
VALLFVSYLGGVVTILSPCVLPVLPFVFARTGRPFATSILPMLIGMALTFAAVATLAAVGGGWVVQANEYGRILAMVLLAVFGLMLLWPRLTDYVTQPLVAFGNRLSQSSDAPGSRGSILGSFVLGIAVGFLWAPCAGPILGLILTGAAIQGANAQTTFLLVAYAAGAATSLAVALLAGGRVVALLKRSLGAGEWVRRGLGALVLVAVAVIALGLDTGLLTRVSLSGTTRLEQALLEKLGPTRPQAGGAMAAGGAMSGGPAMMAGGNAMKANGAMMAGGNAMMAGGNAMSANSGAMSANGAMMAGGGAMMAAAGHGAGGAVGSEGVFPSLDGAAEWLNTAPLTPQSLRGKVVLVDFWTYSCINCLRTLPYVRAWAKKYKDYGLVVIGVHTPEFAFERNLDNVRKAVHDMGITYPVAVDNKYTIWSAFNNNFWPADYFIDSQGQIRGHAFGEGDYEKSERTIQSLLTEAEVAGVPTDLVNPRGNGVEAAASERDVKSPETYVGYERADNFASTPVVLKNQPQKYAAPAAPQLNQWGLAGQWMVDGERAVLAVPGGQIVFRFHARDLHLVLGPTQDGKPVRFRVRLDGKAPGADHGVDADADGNGTVSGQRLYQLIRQQGGVSDRTFTIEFLDPGVQAFSFTFG